MCTGASVLVWIGTCIVSLRKCELIYKIIHIAVDVTVRYIHHTVGIESLWFFSAQRSVEQCRQGRMYILALLRGVVLYQTLC